MNAVRAKELALGHARGWLIKALASIEHRAKDGWFVHSYHLPDKMENGKIQEIITGLKDLGYKVEHQTCYEKDGDCNILNISWD